MEPKESIDIASANLADSPRLPMDANHLLRALLAISRDALVVLDADNHVVFWNSAAAELLRWKGSPSLENGIQVFVPAKLKELRLRLQESRQPAVNFESSYSTPDGRNLQLAGQATVHETMLVASFRLREGSDSGLESIATEILHQSPDAIILTDLNLKIVRWLGNAEQLFGYTAEDVIGKTTDSMVPTSFIKNHMGEFQKKIRDHGVFRGEIPIRCKDGTLILVDLTAKVVFDARNRPIGILGINKDVTERKRAEQEIRKSEARYRKLLEYLPAGVLVHSPTTAILFCNAAAEQILGVDRDRIIGAQIIKPSWMMYREDGSPIPVSELPVQMVLRTGAPVTNYVTRIRKPNEEPDRWIVINAYPEADAEGEVRQVVLAFVDITEQKIVHEELRHSRDMLAKAQRIAKIGHWEFDVTANVSLWSDEMYRIVEHTPGDPASNVETFISRIHPEDRPEFDKTFAASLKGNHRTIDEYRLVMPNGVVKFVRNHVVIAEAKDGVATRMVGTTQDVTDIRQAERALRASEARYLSIIQDQTELVVRWIPGGVRTFVNDAYCRFIGKHREEILGTSFFSKIPQEMLEKLLVNTARLTVENPTNRETRHWTNPQGNEIWIDWTDRAIFDDSGKLVEYQSVGRDISEQKHEEQVRHQLERQVQHAQKLESLGILAGGIAHDFNNLLTGILGNASLALMDCPPQAPSHSSLMQIETICLRAAELCKQMLAYSGKGQFVIELVDLSGIVQEMGNLLNVSISKNILLEYHLKNRLPRVSADVSQIRQVVMNLITNASEAIGERSGTVRISTDAIWADRQMLSSTYLDQDLDPGTYVVMQVSDTGCGMDEKTRSRLFDPFFTTKFTGRGLGLAAVLGIIRGHQGAIRVDTEIGKGTTFTVFFPASEQVGVNSGVITSRPSEYKGAGTVLVVDDEEYIRNITARMLTPAGFQVIVASDGREGVSMFQKHAHEVVAILLDMTMPKLGGAETFREIRGIDPNAKVILSSGYTEHEAVQSFTEGGICGFLQKPYRRQELLAAIQKVIDKG